MKKFKIIGTVFGCFLAITGICLLMLFSIKFIKNKNTSTAVKAVECLYQFNKVEDLNNKMKELEKITTSSVYNQLTVDNEERTLNTYLKFKGNPTSVKIQNVTDSYILYKLDNENIDKDRVFVFMYRINSHGKISYVRECECLDFLQY